MNSKFFVCGIPKAGKTTLLMDVAKQLRAQGLKVGGFTSPEIKEHGTREGFYVQDVETGEKRVLADMEGGGPRVSKYHVEVEHFESIAMPIMEKADKYDVMIIDEIGQMELESIAFEDALDDLLQGDKIVIASLHPFYQKNYESFGEVYTVTPANREQVYSVLLKRIPPLLKEKTAGKPAGKIAKVAVKKIAKKVKVAAKKPARKEKNAGKAVPKKARLKKAKAKKAGRKPEKKQKKEEGFFGKLFKSILGN